MTYLNVTNVRRNPLDRRTSNGSKMYSPGIINSRERSRPLATCSYLYGWSGYGKIDWPEIRKKLVFQRFLFSFVCPDLFKFQIFEFCIGKEWAHIFWSDLVLNKIKFQSFWLSIIFYASWRHRTMQFLEKISRKFLAILSQIRIVRTFDLSWFDEWLKMIKDMTIIV